MMLLASAGQTVMGEVQQGIGALERWKAEKDFQRYEIPSGVNAMMDVMKTLSSQTEMPGSDLLRSKQDKTTAQAVETSQRTSESGSDVLGMLSSVYSKRLDDAQNMAIKNAQFYEQNKLRLANALETFGGYQTEKWKYNELYPYIQAMTAAGQTAAAGSANISSGVGSFINTQGAQANMDWMDKNYGDWMNSKMGKYKMNATPMQPVSPSFMTTPDTKTLAQPWVEDYGRYENNPFIIQ